MKITIDVSAADNPIGVGVYVRNLARKLEASRSPLDQLDFFWSFRPGRPTPSVSALVPPEHRHGWPIPGRILGPIWTAGLPPSADVLSGHPDIFHSTSFLAPSVRKSRLVLTLHAMASHIVPELSEGPPPPRDTYLSLLRRASILISDSESIARELEDAMRAPLPPVRVIPLGVDRGIFRPHTPAELEPILARWGLKPGEYLLSVSTLQPRKNPLRLLEAWRGLPRESRPRLVWAGDPGWKDAPLQKAFREAEPEGLLWLRGFAHRDLPALYSGAIALCYPSVYEGFGLPILEAMACGTPVLTSNTSSMPEVAGDAALLVDPLSVDAIRDAMQRLLGSTLREDLRRKGLERAARFTWEETARLTWDVYREAAGR